MKRNSPILKPIFASPVVPWAVSRNWNCFFWFGSSCTWLRKFYNDVTFIWKTFHEINVQIYNILAQCGSKNENFCTLSRKYFVKKSIDNNCYNFFFQDDFLCNSRPRMLNLMLTNWAQIGPRCNTRYLLDPKWHMKSPWILTEGSRRRKSLQ